MTVRTPLPHPNPQPHSPTRHYDVVIVGGGIVGLTLASALRTSGLRVAIIEAQSSAQSASRQRAYAMSLVSGDIFKSLGLWPQISPHITHFQRVTLSDADFPVAVDFRPQDLGTESVYYAAEHHVLMTALQNSLADGESIHYWAPARLDRVDYRGDRVQCTLTYQDATWTCTTGLIVAADGARSPLREQAGIPTLGWQYWQSCITAVLAPERSHQNTAYERFWPSGPFAILPLPGDRCQIVWTAPHAEAEALLALPREQFMAELQRRYGPHMGRLRLLNEPMMFPVRLMQSRRYVQSRLALVGDAAHCCHPVGGQGLNMGIRDAAALAQVLITAQQRGEDLGSDAVLKRYERWRRRENWIILTLTDSLNRIFSNRWWPLVVVRRAGVWALQHLPPLKWVALSLMTGRFGTRPRLDGIAPPVLH